MPRFSVIIPCFNRTQYLAEAIRSVLGQTIQSLELIVIDDGSYEKESDAIAAICKIDNRIQLTRLPENNGVSMARNTGLKLITGEYVCFLDDDDRLAPSFFQYVQESFEQQPETDIAICQSIVDPSSSKTQFQYHVLKETLKTHPISRIYQKQNPSILYKYPPQINSMAFRKEVFQHHRFDESFNFGEDIYLWLTLLEADFRFGKILQDTPLALIRTHGDQHLSQPENHQITDFLHRLRADFGKADRSLATIIDFKLWMRYCLMKQYRYAFKMLFRAIKTPKPFLMIAFFQTRLKLRMAISYVLYKAISIDI